MTLEELESILIQLSEGKGSFVDPDLNLIYTANYNEVLLYKNLEGMFDLYRKYGFNINILTNGVALTKAKVDLIKANEDIINGILLNIPSGEKTRWAKYVNMNEKLFDKVVSNTRYAIDSLPEMIKRKAIYLMINGLNENSLVENGGWLDILNNAPNLDLDVENGSLAQETRLLKNMFPEIEVFPAHHLYDRAGHLEDFNVIGQSNAISKYLKSGNSKVIGCNGGIGVRSRTEEWIHINPNGDLFICCADFDFKTVFGNLFTQSLKDIWFGEKRQNAIKESYSNMCTKCSAAIWGN